MDEQTKQEQELITIAGGVEMEVAYQNNGDKETVKVRQIPISKISQFVMAMGKDAELIEMYCDKPKGWADTLTLESAFTISEKGEELMGDFFGRWFRLQMKWRERQQGPGNTISAAVENPAPSVNQSPSASSPPVLPTTTT